MTWRVVDRDAQKPSVHEIVGYHHGVPKQSNLYRGSSRPHERLDGRCAVTPPERVVREISVCHCNQFLPNAGSLVPKLQLRTLKTS